MRIRYAVEKRSLPRVDEPPLGKVLRVWNNGFGYVCGQSGNGTTNKEFLETSGVSMCVLLHLGNSRARFYALAHFAINLDHFVAVNTLLSYLSSRKIPRDTDFDEVQILTGLFSHRLTVRALYSALRVFGLRPTVVRCLPLPFPGTYNCSLHDLHGNISLVRIGSVNAEGLLSPLAVHRRAAARRLFSENDHDFVQRQVFEIYPGVPSLDVRTGQKRNRYVVNMRLEREVDRGALAELVGHNGVQVEVCNCPHGQYISIARRGFTNLTTDVVYGVREAAFSVASAIS